jgi:hypothetical protein
MYQENDHISNLFRDNEHLLDEQPSRNAWAKLEEKLDQEKVRSTRRIYRYISTAAAVIAVVAMLSAIALFRNGDELMAERKAEKDALALNEQSTEFSVNNNASDWRKEYAPDSIDKKKEAIAEQKEETSTKTEVIIVKKEKEKIIIADNNTFAESKPKADVAIPKRMQPAPTVSPPAVAKPSVTTANPEVYAEAEIAEETMAEATPTKDNYNNFDAKIITNSSDEVIRNTEKERVATARKYEESAKMNSNTNNNAGQLAEAKAKKATAEKPTINTFSWLKGGWSNNTTLGLSYEKWEQTDKKTLAAKGFLIQNGDTLYVEQIEIKEIKNTIYYIASFERGKAPTKFELVSFINGIATFENPNSEFPSQIILQKEGNGYSISFENSDKIKENQQLKYRNEVSRERASRRMTRAGY